LLAFAERAWHRAEWENDYRAGASFAYGDGKVDNGRLAADWAAFSAKLPQQLRQLDRDGVAYRVAPPGARIIDGKLEANSELPGQIIEYRTGAGAWKRFLKPVAVSGPVELRTLAFDERRTSRVVTVSPR
jgi:hexosaminidase